MKKSFKIGEKGKSAKPVYQGSPLDLILGDDEEKQKDEKPLPEAQKQAVEKKQPKTDIKKGVAKKEKIKVAVKKLPVTSVDKRRVEDKKKPFSTVLRDSLQKELKEILKKYRQEVDFEYNQAQFMEDAILRQLNYIKKQLK